MKAVEAGSHQGLCSHLQVTGTAMEQRALDVGRSPYVAGDSEDCPGLGLSDAK